MEEKIQMLAKKRETVRRKVQRIYVATSDPDNPNNMSKHYLQTQIEMLTRCYKEYNEFQNEICDLITSDERQAQEEMVYIEFERVYGILLARLAQQVEDTSKVKLQQASSAPQALNQAVQPNLPPLKVPLPTFDGSYENWYAFRSMFENIMNRYNAESPAIKLYHLRNALVGKAAGIIDQDIINNNDYAAAWNTLRDRFEDKRLIVNKHIEAILSLPKMTKESAIDLRKLIDICSKNVDALTNLNLPVVGLGEMVILNVISSKMDFETRKAWELVQKPGQLPQYSNTMDFLKDRCKALEKIQVSLKAAGESVKQNRPAVKSEVKAHSLVTTEAQCFHCSGSHPIWKCDTFQKAGYNAQKTSLIKSGACFNCLQRGHTASDCKSTHSCKKCRQRHHTLIHREEQPATPPKDMTNQQKIVPNSDPAPTTASTATTLCTMVETGKSQSLIATAVVLVRGKGDSKFACRAVLDSASHSHFVTEQFATLLGLKRKPAFCVISGINGQQVHIKFKLHTQVESMKNDYATKPLELLVVPRITGDLPLAKFDAKALQIPDAIILADPAFNLPDTVDLLIGSEVFFRLLRPGQHDLGVSAPFLQETQFGWIVSGLVPAAHITVGNSLTSVVEEDDLSRILAKFYEVETCAESPKEEEDEESCLAHFRTTHRRNPDGRYIVRIPFNDLKSELGESRQMAEKRFLSLERRLDREPLLKEQYKAFICEYEHLQHLREISPPMNEESGGAFYVPHHCVLKPSSTTTKLRVVFDGSVESSTGISINQAQYVGPTVQNDLVSILLNFRSYRYAVSADIPKMYRQVAVHPDDQPYQRILWRENNSEPLKVLQLTTVTYGMKSSPFLATMSLLQLVEDEGHSFPLAARAITKSCYIDDMLSGAGSIPELLELKQQLIDLLAKGGFSIHKICSNSSELLDETPEHQRETSLQIDDGNINILTKTLGIVWEPQKDVFRISIPLQLNEGLTKRSILSQIAKIFDPLGFLGPVLTTAKLLMRELWVLDIKWDDTIPSAVAARWKTFREELNSLDGMDLPRRFIAEGAVMVELHGFSDASDHACGACVYARSVASDGSSQMALICSKSKILPKKKKGQPKQISTPRAELEAALLLANLANKVKSALDYNFESTTLWSDSQIVLAWIAKRPEQLLVYVANRVRKIRDITDVADWHYIPSASNPADLISRGLTPTQIINRELWWNGPPTSGNTESPPPLKEDDIPETKQTSLVATVKTSTRLALFDRISRYSIIERAMAYVVRFTDYIRRHRKELTKGTITVDELKRANLLIIRLVQAEGFQHELQLLNLDQSSRHPLRCLSPFIDMNDGLLRVGGRNKHAIIPYDSKHQMLLPEKHPFTATLIRHLHKNNHHLGQRGLLAVVRQRFWPLRAKSVIRKIIHHCIPCFKMRPSKATQLMGNLPDYRVQPAPIFSTAGVDFAGPFTFKSSTQSRKPMYTNGYVCVFVCMSTRSLHLEPVSNLTSEAFLAALQRFVSRRGLPNKLISDNATNFEGACNELGRLAVLFKDEQFQKRLDQFCTQRSIEWSFIPPRSPHFGGIWEAGVKSVKSHLKLILAEHKLTYEEFATVLSQIEAVLNSRPLVPSSDDPNDITAITPAHFIIGREFQAIPEPSYDHIPVGRLSRLQFLQDLKHKFWKIWMTDYLQELQRRQKDYKITEFKPGALVLIVDDNIAPLQWSLARIIDTHPGTDGHTRVVTLKTKNGTTKRAVKKICLLPLDSEE
ncbi:uncharacterized protein LOC134290488 [Aedes albopictus]|uniref:Endonuclease n=1 Tax=Aedes albopictus TaxID=7160 RepID=A0ABM1YDE9_AEDAL